MHDIRESMIQPLSDLFALQRHRCRTNRNLAAHLDRISRTFVLSWARVAFATKDVTSEVLLHFISDHGYVCTEIICRKADFHEFLLLHKQIVRAVVYYILAEYGRGQVRVGFFGVDV